MGQQLLCLCRMEAWRLIWLTGMMFALILVFQYFALPYGNLPSSLFSTGKVLLVGKNSFQTGGLPSQSEYTGNMMVFFGSNSHNTSSFRERVNNTSTSKGRDRNPKDDSVSDRNGGSNHSLRLDEDISVAQDSSPENLVELNDISGASDVESADLGSAAKDATEPEQKLHISNNTTDGSSSIQEIGKDDNISSSGHTEISNADILSPSPAVPHMNRSPHAASTPYVDKNTRTPVLNSNTSSLEKDKVWASYINENTSKLQTDLILIGNNSSPKGVPEVNKGLQMPNSSVVSISAMSGLLLQSRASFRSVIPLWSSLVDQDLLNMRLLIENAPLISNDPDLYAPLYRNVSMFKRSYELMEDNLKIYIYREGEKPIFHQPRLKGIYASEGWFMKLLEANEKFTTRCPGKAHLFYLPFSSLMVEESLYIANSHSFDNLIQYLKNYLEMIAAKYSFWNRTGGADHFLVACHDWAPTETKQYMAKCIRALCNANVKEGFVLGKDVSLPETYVRLSRNPLKDLGGKTPSQRSTLAFFAGSMHGYVRPVLLQHWENKDPDMKIFGKMRKSKGNKNYLHHMKNSKYCICAKGHEVNSPRVVEAIFYECVPVIISDNFVPPFFEVLNWESFAVFILEKDIPNLKSILLSIPEKRYLQMQVRVKKVQKHFLWHAKPVKYDIFNMILHSIWYNRLYQISPL